MMKHLRGIKRKLDLLNLNENWEKEKEELKGKLSLMTYLLPQLQAQMVVLHYQPKPRHLKKRKILDSNQNTKNTVDKENLSVDMMNRVMESELRLKYIIIAPRWGANLYNRSTLVGQFYTTVPRWCFGILYNGYLLSINCFILHETLV